MKKVKSDEYNHPMEAIFDMEPGSTELHNFDIDTPTEIPKAVIYDEKDEDIEAQMQNIHNVALEAFQQQIEMSQLADPKYAVGNMEVAVQLLNTGLQALKQRSVIKMHKDKLSKDKGLIPQQTNITNNNNTLVVGSRTEILKRIKNGDFQ